MAWTNEAREAQRIKMTQVWADRKAKTVSASMTILQHAQNGVVKKLGSDELDNVVIALSTIRGLKPESRRLVADLLEAAA